MEGRRAHVQLRLIWMSSLETMSATSCFCSSPSVVPGFLCVHVGETPGKQGGDWKLATLTSGVKQAPAAGGGLKLRGAAVTQGSSLTSSINLPVSAASMRGTLESLHVFPAHHHSDARHAHCHSGPQTVVLGPATARPLLGGPPHIRLHLQLRQASHHTASRQACQKYSRRAVASVECDFCATFQCR